MNNYLGEIGLILLGIVLFVVFVPIFLGMFISHLLGLVGQDYYSVLILITLGIWLILGLIYYL